MEGIRRGRGGTEGESTWHSSVLRSQTRIKQPSSQLPPRSRSRAIIRFFSPQAHFSFFKNKNVVLSFPGYDGGGNRSRDRIHLRPRRARVLLHVLGPALQFRLPGDVRRVCGRQHDGHYVVLSGEPVKPPSSLPIGVQIY